MAHQWVLMPPVPLDVGSTQYNRTLERYCVVYFKYYFENQKNMFASIESWN